MNMFRRLASSTMAFSLELLLLGSTIPEPTFRPTRQELLRPPTRSWLVHGPVAHFRQRLGLQTVAWNVVCSFQKTLFFENHDAKIVSRVSTDYSPVVANHPSQISMEDQ